MKKFILALTALLVMTVSASAMSYEQARQQALFLTDKMAYELNLTDAQYEAAYEINLDYLMGVRTVDDLYGTYWERRRLDFSYILLSWQYRAFCDAAYFFRPLYWDAGYWHFGIYARYPHRDYFFFGRPTFYVEYRGGHAWHMNGGRSWYRSRHYRPTVRHDNRYHGMRDFSRGDFGNGYRGNPNSATSFGAARRPPVMNGNSFGNSKNNGNSFGNGKNNGNSFGNGKRPAIGGARTSNGSSFGNANRESSTRSTETKGGSSFGGHRSGSVTSVPRNTFSPSTSTGGSSSNESTGSSFGRRPSSSSNSTFGGSRRSSSFGSNSGSSSFGNSSGSSSFGGSRRSSSFGGSKSSGSSFGGSKSSGSSFGGSRSSSSSFGSSRSGGSSFGSSRSSGSSFGGHR